MNVSLQSKPSTVPVQVADSDKIVMGAGFRLPPAPAHVTDFGQDRAGRRLSPAGRAKDCLTTDPAGRRIAAGHSGLARCRSLFPSEAGNGTRSTLGLATLA